MHPSPSILITAFEPFGGSASNSSLEALRALPDTIADAAVHKAILPVVFGRCARTLAGAIAAYHPSCILSLGMAAGRDRITPEVFAVNARCSGSPDNDGQLFSSLTPIAPDGPAAFASTLPVEKMVACLRAHDIPAGLSFSAGAYVCNDLFYHLMQIAKVPAGFVHLPQAREAAVQGRPALEREQIDRGVALLAELLIKTVG